MEELETYSFDPAVHRARALNTIEAEVRRLFLSGDALGLNRGRRTGDA